MRSMLSREMLLMQRSTLLMYMGVRPVEVAKPCWVSPRCRRNRLRFLAKTCRACPLTIEKNDPILNGNVLLVTSL